MNGFLEWLFGPPPCPHEYETITVLKDRPRNPTAATIWQACKLCGQTRQETIHAPVSKEKKRCPPHHWKIIKREAVYKGATRETARDMLPIRYDTMLQCQVCGDLKCEKGASA